MKRYILYHKEMGIYLGNCMDLGFWSMLDAVGQTHAITFSSGDDAFSFANTWDEKVLDLELCEVEVKDPPYASMAECVEAGLSVWK